jgi:DNA-binding transcriptional MerR regulator
MRGGTIFFAYVLIIDLQHGFKVKQNMRIGELALAAGCSASRIRFYEKQGLIDPAVRRDNNYREYPASVVQTLGLILRAQAFGFSLAEIGEGLRKDLGNDRRCEHVLGMLRAKLADTDRHLQDIGRLRTRLVGQIAELEQGLSSASTTPHRP